MREPGPYCPDTGQAQTTWKASLVSFVALTTLRALSAGILENKEARGPNGYFQKRIEAFLNVEGKQVQVRCESVARDYEIP